VKKCTLITVYDPLCGWCYGFGPVLIRLSEAYSNRINFDVISGGMITGASVGPLSNMAAFISKAYQTVEHHTGVKFGPGFLEKTLPEGKATFSSLEPSNVLTVLKSLRPKETVKASHEIQQLIYRDGIDPVNYEAYLPIFTSRGIDEKEAMNSLKSAGISQESVLEFAQAQNWKIRGFPACLVETPDGKLFGISNGFLPYEALEERIIPYLAPEV